MTAQHACKLIDYHTYRSHKRLTGQLRRIRAGRSRQPAKRAKNPIHRLPSGCIGTDFDHQLQLFENRSRCECLNIYKNLSLDKLPSGLEKMLARSILSALQRIGFEATIAKILFETASSAWKLMGRADEGIIPYQPQIDREIEAVRQGFQSIFYHCNPFSEPAAKGSRPIPGSIQHGHFPEQLFEMLVDIPTPWIILPRAFRFLEKDQCRYLPPYTKILDTEDRELSLRLFSRIAIEFIANYSFKFADRRHPKDQLSKLLFYGYATLYWKTLRRPPENLKNSAIFDHFFNWICWFARQNGSLGRAEKSWVDQMRKMKAYAFPAINTKSYPNSQRFDSARFLVTLRHGAPGVAATLRHFGIDQFLETRRTGNRFTCLSFQKELLSLLYRIRTHYHTESKGTRTHIKHFINQLGAVCDTVQPDFNRSQQQFVRRLVNQMQKFVNS